MTTISGDGHDGAGEQSCRECGRKIGRAGGFCRACGEALRAQATAEQEREYAWRWLRAREGETGTHLRIVRAWAKARRLDWRKTPPPPMTYDQRMARLTQRAPQQRQAPRGKRSQGAA